MSQRRPSTRVSGPMKGHLPVEGFYRVRLRKGAPWVPARIVSRVARDPDTGERLDRSPRLLCFVAGEERDPFDFWPSLWPISREEYDRLLASMPDDPREPMDAHRSAPVF